jgi:hypothetical protein
MNRILTSNEKRLLESARLSLGALDKVTIDKELKLRIAIALQALNLRNPIADSLDND